MARQPNRMITFNDAIYMVNNEGFIEDANIPSSDVCMTRSDIENHFSNVDTSGFSSYNMNRLVPYDKIQTIPALFYESNGTVFYTGNTPGETGHLNGDTNQPIFTAVDNNMLSNMDPSSDDYTTIATTLVTDLDFIFSNTYNFNQDISTWDVSNVTTMVALFNQATSFNQNINNWNVSNVTNMNGTFANASSFNQPLDNWDLSNTTNIDYMFGNATSFNQPLNSWDVSNITSMVGVFFDASSFNQPLNNWDTSNLPQYSTNVGNTNMTDMFNGASNFNQDISMWCVQNIPNKPPDFDSLTSATWTTSEKPNWGVSC